MHEIYSTKAFIFFSKIKSDSNEEIILFTEDFGLLKIEAISSKKQNSKHSSIIQDLSFTEVFLVPTKKSFRLTGGRLIENLCFDKEIKFKVKKIKILKNITILLQNIFILNNADKKIFDLLEKLFFSMKDSNSEKNIQLKELYFLKNLFSHLGYLNIENFNNLENKSSSEIQILTKTINNQIQKVVF
ncbi:MAG: hypothetical protein LRZ98_01340 [Candidatus Pacebacteria bacterium]|nr:hypothetical protein [Candidatus Paceibacterota bacterium]